MAKVNSTKGKIFHQYMFFESKPAKRGIFSLILGGIALALIIAGIVMSYGAGGRGGTVVGSMGLTGMILAGFGVFFGFQGFKEEERNYFFCKVGIIFCACIFIFVVALFFIGL